MFVKPMIWLSTFLTSDGWFPFTLGICYSNDKSIKYKHKKRGGKKKEYVLQNKVVAQRGSHTCWYGNKRHSEEGGRGFEQWVTLGVSVSCISLYKPRPHWLFITWFHSIWNVSDSRELIVNDCVQKTLKFGELMIKPLNWLKIYWIVQLVMSKQHHLPTWSRKHFLNTTSTSPSRWLYN